jgi:hypothetical protein
VTQFTLPDGTTTELDSNDALLVHGVDENGTYVGLVAPGTSVDVAGSAPPDDGVPYRWLQGQWRRRITLTIAKLMKWQAVKERRDEIEFGTFTWNGSVFDADAASRSRLNSAAQAVLIAMVTSQPVPTMTWSLADNTTLDLTGPDLLGVALALITHTRNAHAAARLKRVEILAAGTVAEVLAIELQ